MADATAALLDTIRSDPDRWETVRGVPVFRAHSRTFPEVKLPDGTVIPKRTREFTEPELYELATKINAVIKESGELPTLTIGHRSFEPGFPEDKQPKLTGFGHNYRVEQIKHEGKAFAALVHDELVMKDKRDALSQYPYRSLEINTVTGKVLGTAMLVRPPYLELGTTIVYQADMDGPGDKPPVEPTEGPQDTEAEEQDKFSDAEVKSFERCYAYFMAKSYLPDPKEAPLTGEKEMSEKTAAKDTSKPEADPVVQNQGDVSAIAQYQAQRADLERQVAEERQARVVAECRQLLDPLKPLRKFDYNRELNTLANLPTAEERLSHVKYMAETYMPLPTGSMIRVYEGDPTAVTTSDSDPTKPPANYEAVMTEIRTHPGLSYDEAEQRVKAKSK